MPFTAPEIDAKLKSIDSLSNKIEEIKNKINSSSGNAVSSWNDLQDKPFEELEPEINITWDGEIGDRFAMDLTPLGYAKVYLVKISDMILTVEQLVGSTVMFSDGGYEILNYDYIDTVSFPGGISAGTISII